MPEVTLKPLWYKQVFLKLFGERLNYDALTYEQLSFQNVFSAFDDSTILCARQYWTASG